MCPSDDRAGHENPTVTAKSNGESQISLTTASDREKRMHAFPKCPSWDGVKEISGALRGVELSTLVPFDTIAVRTVNTDYRIFLLDPGTGRALLERNREITEAVEVRVIGSSFGSSILRTGWIGVGLRIEAWANGKYISTSTIQSLCVAR